MRHGPLPQGLKKVLALVESNPRRVWRLPELAAAARIAPRTLQKHFRHFFDRAPLDYLGDLRLERARRDLLQALPGVSVTDVATRWGFTHLGRFGVRYRKRYGEPPSATMRRCRSDDGVWHRLPFLSPVVERPAVAVLPPELIGETARCAAALNDEITGALLRLGWLTVTAAAASARYHLRGKVCDDGRGRLRVALVLVDAEARRYLWAHRFDCDSNTVFDAQEHIAASVTCALQASLREAEISRAAVKDRAELTAWELTMRALPNVMSFEPARAAIALELLDQAMELAPRDPLPLALAAWCRGLRAGHHFVARTEQERKAAQGLAARAASLSTGDVMTEALLAAGYTVAHDLDAATMHVDRALAIDGGSAWAWGRSGWIKVYAGEADEAVERFQVARALAPADPLNWLCSIGTACAHFAGARYDEAIRWYQRGLAEHPTALWCNKGLTPAYALAGRKDEARHSLAKLLGMYPDLTVSHVRHGLPMSADFLNRAAEGLHSAGMRLE